MIRSSLYLTLWQKILESVQMSGKRWDCQGWNSLSKKKKTCPVIYIDVTFHPKIKTQIKWSLFIDHFVFARWLYFHGTCRVSCERCSWQLLCLACRVLPWADWERNITGKADSRAHLCRKLLETDRQMCRWRYKVRCMLDHNICNTGCY